MYDELINSLRICGKMRSIDDYCVAFHDGCCEAEPVCMYELMKQAADAIEELSKYANYIGRLKCEGWYLQQTKYRDGYHAVATMPLPEPPKGE